MYLWLYICMKPNLFPLSQSFIDDPVLFSVNFFLFGISSCGCVCPLALLRERLTHEGLTVIASEGFCSVAFSTFDLGYSEISGNLLTLTRVLARTGCAANCTWLLECSSSFALLLLLRRLSPLSVFSKGENGHGWVDSLA